ncbi:NAD(P)-binding protein [Trametopsis cervina]|nr:NAD(P)-binding protein [Trametopsis cervina]
MSTILRSRLSCIARRQFLRTSLASRSLRLKARSYATGSAKESPLNTHSQPKTAVQPSYGPVGVAAALQASPNDPPPTPTLLTREFSLSSRVALITGANSGLGLEASLALLEAGARAVYCVDLPKEPGEEWEAVRRYAGRLALAREGGRGTGEGRMEYVCADVRDQEGMWKVGEMIGEREGRLDVCVAAAGVPHVADCLDIPAAQFSKVMDVNTNGVLYTAQAAGQQMARFGNGGSIILMASIAGSVTLQGVASIAYNTSKSAVLQMARSMACELGPRNIRVNSLSPGWMYTNMVTPVLAAEPKLEGMLAGQNPLGRMGRADELRGVVVWLASDASSFCTGSDIVVSGGHHAW